MKRFLYISTVMVLMATYSCDKIDNPIINKGTKVSIPVVAPTHVDSTTKASDTTLNILVEDYTAHNCTNCPVAAGQCEKLVKGAHGNQVVLMQVNVGNLGAAYPPHSFPGLPDTAFGISYRTPAGDNWNNTFINGNGNGLPGTMVNRVYYDNGIPGSPDLFLYGIDVSASGTPFDSLVTANHKTASIHIVDSMYAPPTSTVSMTVTAKLLAPQPGNQYYLVVALVEDSIFDWQDSVSHYSQYYLKHMTLRTVINDPTNGWGDALSDTTAIQTKHYAYSNFASFQYNNAPIIFPPQVPTRFWNMAHMYVVAFVYQRTAGSQDYMVLQAQRLHL